MTYADKLKDPRWQRKRLEILQRDNFTCTLCLDEKSTLHVHHLKYNGNPWDSKSEDLQTLCECCHKFVEILKKSDHWQVDYITGIIKSNSWNDTYHTVLTDNAIYTFSINTKHGVVEDCQLSLELSDLYLIIDFLRKKGIYNG